jgi:hypothetical protein
MPTPIALADNYPSAVLGTTIFVGAPFINFRKDFDPKFVEGLDPVAFTSIFGEVLTSADTPPSRPTTGQLFPRGGSVAIAETEEEEEEDIAYDANGDPVESDADGEDLTSDFNSLWA